MRLVDADKLKERFIGEFGADNLLLNAILEFIDDEDAVEPVPQGEWEERIVECESPWLRRRFYCSNCGDWQTYGMTRFCQNCGAIMAKPIAVYRNIVDGSGATTVESLRQFNSWKEVNEFMSALPQEQPIVGSVSYEVKQL